MQHLTDETINLMTRSNMFLGSRRVKRHNGNASIRGDIDDWYPLLQPSEVAIVDDTKAYELFGDRILCAPQRDIIESTQSSVFELPNNTHCY